MQGLRHWGDEMSLFNMFKSFISPERGYDKASDLYSQYYANAQRYLQPYNQQGLDQYGRLNTQADKLNNPVQLENDWASSYTESPYAKFLKEDAKNSGLDAASSMGLIGSSSALNNIMNSSSNISQSFRQKYMDDLMQKFMTSIGIGQNLYGTGENAASTLSGNTMNAGENLAQTAYGKANAPGASLMKLIGLAADAGINYATGGVAKGATGGVR
jgi:hypothetical protein